LVWEGEIIIIIGILLLDLLKLNDIVKIIIIMMNLIMEVTMKVSGDSTNLIMMMVLKVIMAIHFLVGIVMMEIHMVM